MNDKQKADSVEMTKIPASEPENTENPWMSQLREMFQLFEKDENFQESQRRYLDTQSKTYQPATHLSKLFSGTASGMRFGRDTVGSVVGGVAASPFALLEGAVNAVTKGDDSWSDEDWRCTAFIYGAVKYAVGSVLFFIPAIISGVVDSVTCNVIKNRGDEMANGMWKLLKVVEWQPDSNREQRQKREQPVHELVNAIINEYKNNKSMRQSVSSRELIKELEKYPDASANTKVDAISRYMNNKEHIGHKLYNIIAARLVELGKEPAQMPRLS